MQRCILEGHKPVEQSGTGPYAGQSFLVCSECGKDFAADLAELRRRTDDIFRRAIQEMKPKPFWPPPGAN